MTPEDRFRILMVAIEAGLRKEGLAQRMDNTYYGSIEVAATCKEGMPLHVRVRLENGHPVAALVKEARESSGGNLTPTDDSV